MNRGEFLAGLTLSPAVLSLSVSKDDVGDPAADASSQALRVLLGKGQARTLDPQTFVFNGRRYRGTFSSMQTGEIVNTLAVEQYLYGVVSREMPPSWPDAALQTQAIVARTYVLARSNPTQAYDLVPSQADQVYTGMDAEHLASSAAVDQTSGQVLRAAAGFAQAVYSSCCGGHTESNAAAWGGRLLSYLAGVPCPYCTQSPWYRWRQHVGLAQLQAALPAQAAPPIGDLQEIALDPPDPSGRVAFWTFTGTQASARVKAAQLRAALGMHALPSLLVRNVRLNATQAEPTVTIEGGGLGHGVGLCQWGARGMALAGADARAILRYYYPGTMVGND